MAAEAATAAVGGAPLHEMQTIACVSKGGDLTILDEETVTSLKSSLCPTWHVVEEGKKLQRHFTCKNFAAALAAVNGFGAVAEEQGHHPDLAITSYRDVTITLFTHALGGLSINDFILAARLDRVPITYSPKWLQQHPDTTAGVGAASAP